MCGLAGFIKLNASEKKMDDFLEHCKKSLFHRGPDSQNILKFSKKNAFIHTRLSVLGNEIEGTQPKETDRYILIFNGEIYNYIELSKKYLNQEKDIGDTTTLIKLIDKYGINILNKLDGMYSIVLFDKVLEKLILVRDPYGQKPLFYSKSKNFFFFCSELKPLLFISDKKLNLQGFIEYLKYGHCLKNRTLIKDIIEVEPNKIFIFDIKNKTATSKNLKIKTNDCNINFFESIKKSVEITLRSHVPISVLLSGGIDSSLISALSNKAVVDRLITTKMKNFNKNDLINSRKVAKKIKIKHSIYQMDQPSIKDLIKMISGLPQPLCDSSMIAMIKMLNNSKKSGSKVFIGGDGSDELFLGYDRYKKIVFLEFFKYFPFKKLLSLIFKRIEKNRAVWKRGNFILRLLSYWGEDKSVYDNKIFRSNDIFNLLNKKHFKNFEKINKDHHIPKFSLKNFRSLDIDEYLRKDILVKSDISSMKNSVELRTPFLNNYSLSIKNRNIKFKEKISLILGNTKKPLKKILIKLQLEDITKQRKSGFNVPLDTWFRKKENLISLKKIINETEIFSKAYIEKIFNAHQKGFNNGERILNLLVISFWIKNNKVIL